MIEELKMKAEDPIIVTHEMGFARAVGEQVIAEGRIAEYARQVLITCHNDPQFSRVMVD
jgi:ABC-type polar amino acid transport system ATPase subunit